MYKNIVALAKKLSENSDHSCPMAAVIHRKKQIFSSGWNKCTKTHPLSEKENYNIGHHAELSAIIGIRYRKLNNLEITVIRISKKTGKFALAKPCKHCMELIRAFGIKRIHFTNEYGKFTTIRI